MSTPYLIPNLLSHKIKGLKASKLELDWENFVEIVQKELPDSYKQQFTPCSESQEFGLNPWSGTQILEEAISFLLKGWKEGADTLKKVQESLPKELFEKILPSQSFQKTQHHVVSGGTIDMGMAVSDCGPTHFVEETQDENSIKIGNKLQTIYMNCANNSNIDPDMFFVRGSLMYSLIYHLETIGFNTEVYAYFPISNSSWGRDSSECTITYIKIKSFNEMFDEHKMLVAICSAFMLRRFVFRLEEMFETKVIKLYGFDNMTTKGGYGSTMQSITPEELKINEKENSLVFDVANENNKEQIIEKFKLMLTGLYKIVSHDGLGDQFGEGNEGSWAM